MSVRDQAAYMDSALDITDLSTAGGSEVSDALGALLLLLDMLSRGAGLWKLYRARYVL